ncbi:MAG TPA: PASTA domain-containing protein [Gaiella sp.]|nr:PASTA domain-containing protein [Gaiella sp.]
MKRQIFGVAVLLALLAPNIAGARGSAYGVAIRGASVNGDHSVTIAWELESANVFNRSLAVDGSVVRSGSDRATIFTTKPLSGGSHTITIEARELFETYTSTDASCVVSGGHYVCARNWRSSMSVNVPYETDCLVPRVVGFPIAVAKARITRAKCAIGTVKRVRSKRPAGTVLSQRPTETGRQLPDGTAIDLVVSVGAP